MVPQEATTMVAAMGGIISQPDIAEMRTEVMQVPVPMVPMIMVAARNM